MDTKYMLRIAMQIFKNWVILLAIQMLVYVAVVVTYRPRNIMGEILIYIHNGNFIF